MRRVFVTVGFAAGAALIIAAAALPAPSAASSALSQGRYCATGSPHYCARETRCWGSDFWHHCTTSSTLVP